MKTTQLLAAIVFGIASMGAIAAPLSLTSQYQTSAAVTGGTDSDAHFGTSPPTAPPLITSATVSGATYFASGSGIAADGLLSTEAEADSDAVATAVGSSEYSGSFLSQATQLNLGFSFTPTNASDTDAFGSTTLLLTLLQNGATVYSELFTDAGSFDRQLAVALNGQYTVDFLLSSEADTFSGGTAYSSGLLSFQVAAIPEPSTALLMLLSLAVLIGVRSIGPLKFRSQAARG